MIPGWAVEELARRTATGNGTNGAHGTNGGRGRLVQEYAERYGVSESTVYRKLRRLEGKKAGLKITEPEKAAAFVVSGYLQACMSKKGVAPSTEMALSELAKMGKLPGQDRNGTNGANETNGTDGGFRTSRQRMDQVMAALGISKAHMARPKPCVRLTALGPNEWHEVDWSPAGMFYLESGWVGVTPNYKKNTVLRKGKTPIRIGMVVDVYSGCCFARAYEAAGESTELAVRTLYDAWRDKQDLGFPMHGVPNHLYSDQTGAIKSGPTQALLDNLFVTPHGHAPRRPTATGLAENRIRASQRWETLIRGRQAFGYQFKLDQFNSWLMEWCVNENNRRHVIQRKRTRFQVWSDVQEENIRQCPEWKDFIGLSAALEMSRNVSQYCEIQMDGELYPLVGAQDLVGKKVHVYRLGDGQMFAKHGGKVFGPLAPGVSANVLGIQHRQPRLTESEKNLRGAREAAQGIGMKVKDMPYLRDPESEIFVPRSGREMILEATKGTQATKVGSVLEAKDWLVSRVGSLADLGWETLAAVERALDRLLELRGEITAEEMEKIAEVIGAEKEEEVRHVGQVGHVGPVTEEEADCFE